MDKETKIKKIQSFETDKDLAMFEEVQTIADALVNLKNVVKIKGDKGDNIKGDKGDKGNSVKGDKGEKPTTTELLKIIKPLIPEPIKGEDGKDADIETIVAEVLAKVPEVDKQEIIDLVVKQLPTSGEAFRDGLELLQDDERLNITAIKGLKKKLDKITKGVEKTSNTIPPSARDMFIDIDLSSQLDGSTKTFNIQAVWNILSVSLSSFPNVLRKNVDFTFTPTSITFTSEISAETSLAVGQTCVLTVVLA